LYEKELKNAARAYCQKLNRDTFTAITDLDSVRDYSIKITVSVGGRDIGKIVLYHKPSKGSFSPRFHELKEKEFIDQLQEIWDGREAGSGEPNTSGSGYEAYIDGSFSRGRVGWGMVLLRDGDKIHETFGTLDDPALVKMHQVAGELKAAMETVAWAERQGITTIRIYFDYTGIMHWAKGSWKTNNPATAAYRDFMNRQRSTVIEWIKVPAHSGNRWNDYADMLAKKGTAAKDA